MVGECADAMLFVNVCAVVAVHVDVGCAVVHNEE